MQVQIVYLSGRLLYLIPSAQRENFHQIEWDKKTGILEEKKEPFWYKIRVMKHLMNENIITSIVESQKVTNFK